jgi:hypothetical protein
LFFVSDHVLLTVLQPLEIAMTSRPSAEIIPFPGAQRSHGSEAPVGEAAEDPGERLRRALAALEAAVAAQRMAVSGWRDAIADLRGTMAGLGTSLRTYNGALDSLGTRVDTLHASARCLEAWADSALSRQE